MYKSKLNPDQRLIMKISDLPNLDRKSYIARLSEQAISNIVAYVASSPKWIYVGDGDTDRFVNTQALDVGLNLGVSYLISEQFLVDTRVYTGFIKAAEVTQPYAEVDDIEPPLPSYTLRNRAIVFSFTYLF